MNFIEKIEASYAVEADIRKPTKITKSKDKKASPVPTKIAEAKGEKVGFSDLTNTRKLTPLITKELQLTDPFDFTNETWTRFTKTIAPKLLTALLLDMNVVPKTKRAEFARYLERRLRSLAKN